MVILLGIIFSKGIITGVLNRNWEDGGSEPPPYDFSKLAYMSVTEENSNSVRLGTGPQPYG